jgi:alkylation response protein AidB-like acyl-CoA dehydrogenase
MNLRLTEEQELLRDMFAELLATESSPDRVRRVPEALGGSDTPLLEACLVAEQAGRHLASAPLIESIVACGLLARIEHSVASSWLSRALAGEALVSFAPRPVGPNDTELVPGGAVADAVVALDGDALVLVERGSQTAALGNLGASPVGRWSLSASRTSGTREVLAQGEAATRAFEAAQEEWKLLSAAALIGLAQRAIEIAAAYATERTQFDRPIGAFQAIAHPLANCITDIEGGRLLLWRALTATARREPEAGALISMSYAWAARAASATVGPALHTHGGYGLSLEYDIQLYHRRAKTWSAYAGNPDDEFVRAAERLWGDVEVSLPEAGELQLDFGLGAKAEAFAQEARRFFEENLTDELRAKAHFSWDGHDEGLQRKLAEAGLLFPSWPLEYGGQDRDPYEAAAAGEEWSRAGWTTHAVGTTRMVAETLMKYGSEELKLEVLPRIARGEAVCSLGYTEPASGSDVAAAQTRAVRDGDGWRINGQKMFTSGANVSQYVFLLTRTDPEARKHRGLSMFLVPLDTPGIEIQPIYTLSDERTNATYYSDVRIPDRYRVGEVNEGWSVVGYALELEHGAGGLGSVCHEHNELVDGTARWALTPRADGSRPFDDPRVRERLGLAATHARVSQVLSLRSLWTGIEGLPNRAEGPMSALFAPEAQILDSTDLLALAAPDSILSKGQEGAAADGEIEFAYRVSTAMSIYGGTSEIMRSIIAQTALGMPRSRS